MSSDKQPFTPAEPTLVVIPWHDPVVDSIGHEVRSTYVELFWLNVLGPTATWALRRPWWHMTMTGRALSSSPRRVAPRACSLCSAALRSPRWERSSASG